MRLFSRFSTILLLLIAISHIHTAKADWWDDFVDGVHSKLIDGANYIKEKAGPTIREKFNVVKEKLQDPQTHEDAQIWVKEVFKNYGLFRGIIFNCV